MAVIENPNSADLPAGRARVLELLQQAARTIDRMWLSARTEGPHAAAVSLGQASHGVHRALIALREGAAPD